MAPVKSISFDNDTLKKIVEIREELSHGYLNEDELNDSLLVRMAIRRMHMDICIKNKNNKK